jgi:hypothetical protein
MQKRAHFWEDRGKISDYAKQNNSFFRFSESIGGISPSIYAIFIAKD